MISTDAESHARGMKRPPTEEQARFQALAEMTSDTVAFADADGKIVYINPAGRRTLGIDEGEIVAATTISDYSMPDAVDPFMAAMGPAAERDCAWRGETLWRHRDGHPVRMSQVVTAHRDPDGEVAFYATIARDITREERSDALVALNAAVLERVALSQPLSEILDALLLGIEALAPGMRASVLLLDETGERLRHGAAPSLPAGYNEAIDGVAVGPSVGSCGTAVYRREPVIVEDVAHDPLWADFRELTAEHGLGACWSMPIISAAGEVLGTFAIYYNEPRLPGESDRELIEMATHLVLTSIEHERAEWRLRQSEERFRSAFDGAPVGIGLLDPDGHFVRVNPALCEIAGRGSEGLVGVSLESIAYPSDARSALQLCGGPTVQTGPVELRLLRPGRSQTWVSASCAVLPAGNGKVGQLILHVQDIDGRKRLEGRMRDMADRDPLTGLLNRRRLETELESHADRGRRYGPGGALLLIDLDQFKRVNDTFGHGAGDALLVNVATLFSERVRASDTLARLGGDEFAVLLPKATEEQAAGVAGDLLATIREQTMLPGGATGRRVTASVGIATFDAMTSAQEVLVQADRAMYEAKQAGRDRFVVHSSQGQSPRSTLDWAERIERAFTDDRFVLYAQPIVSAGSDGGGRYELLLRLQDDDGEIIGPNAFIPTAERYDLVQAIDRWVVTHALELLASTAGSDVSFHANISARSIGDNGLMKLIEAGLARHRVDPARLTFEITETAALTDLQRASGFADRLTEFGCRLALDDFGAGFASFNYVKQLPFDYLKIDGEFVRACVANHTDRLVIDAIVGIARGLGKETIAESVEDADTAAYLADHGVDHLQGYWLGRPGPTDELIASMVVA